MARKGIPRLRHLNHRHLERTVRQPIITDFLTERSDTLTEYADEAAVWDALKTNRPETIAAQVEPAPE